ncbi:IS200/IS605 family transposase [Spirochaetia bacterium]|nr:IS200/IS605 family transposase [Spirochaetia bacterium]
MKDYKSLSHSVWDCKYHIVWIPKFRKKKLYGEVATYLGEIFHELARQRESKIVEGHICPDHIHMLIEIPPKYAVAEVVGYIKGKSAIAIARTYLGKRQNFTGQNFWARGYFVSTVGLDEEVIKQYIRGQETEDKRLDQLDMFKDN